MIEALHWIGSAIGAIGFIQLTSTKARIRWWGSLVSLVAIFMLLTWATLAESYGLYLLWGVIGLACIRGMITNWHAKTRTTEIR